MYQHVLRCIKNKRIECFPAQNGSTVQHCKRKTIVTEVLCSCKQLYYPVIVMCIKCEEVPYQLQKNVLKFNIDNQDIDLLTFFHRM